MTDELYDVLLSCRKDLNVIANIIPGGIRLLDLGCGDGGLLKLLAAEKDVKGLGVEISQDDIIECVANGVPVIHGDLNQKLMFKDNAFDYVVLSQTLQAVERPDRLLQEMLRVGHHVVISFINFGYVHARLQLLIQGRMPVTKTLPDMWYDTRNIHLGTIGDFRDLCRKLDIKIVQEIPLGHHGDFWARFHPNLFAPFCVFVMTKK